MEATVMSESDGSGMAEPILTKVVWLTGSTVLGTGSSTSLNFSLFCTYLLFSKVDLAFQVKQ